MYKRFLVAAFMVLSLIVSPLLSLSAQALSPLPYLNSLVKIDGNATVYWRALDGKRYVFPNARTFYSWFSPEDLSRVITISPQEMGSIAIGGNVTYRPGVRLVKVTTDPRVYAVSRYGVLRWITSEALAVQLYGQNWAQQVDDVPDEFFTNYRVGDAVYTSAQFNVQFEMGQARSPSDNIQTNNTLPPNNNSLRGQVSLSVSNPTPLINEAITLTASTRDLNISSVNTRLTIHQAETGLVLITCTGYSCNITTGGMFQTRDIGSSFRYFARVTNIQTGETLDSGTAMITLRANTSVSGTPTISANTANPSLGQTVTITANTNGINPQTGSLLIIGPSGNAIQTCAYSTTCTYSFVMDTVTRDTILNNFQGYYPYFARFLPVSGNAITSSQVNVYAPGSSNTNLPATAHTITFNRSSISPGESFTVTSRLTPDATSGPYYTIRIYDQWSVLQHTCERVRTCVLQQTLSQTSDTSRTYYASAVADTGHSIGSGNATIQISQSSGSTNARLGNSQLTLGISSDNVLTLVPSMTVYSGSEIRLSANVTPAISNPVGIAIKFYTSNNTLLSTCTGYNSCSITQVLTNTGGSDTTQGFKMRVEDAYGAWYETPVSSVIVRPLQQMNTISGTIGLGISHASIPSNQQFTLNARVQNSNVSDQNLAINWYQSSNGALMSSCDGTNPCLISTSYPALNGESRVLSFYAKAYDRTGAYSEQLVSSPVSITITP